MVLAPTRLKWSRRPPRNRDLAATVLKPSPLLEPVVALQSPEPTAPPLPSVRVAGAASTGCLWLSKYPPRTEASRLRYERAKRVMDVVFVMLLAPLWLPLLLLLAAAVSLSSPGAPVLFRQHRTGRGLRRFVIFKFRTMVPNAEELKAQLAHLNQRTWPDFKIDPDPRVTRLGRILRKTSLDELPQLLNVLRGDMSLVGPRPTTLAPGSYEPWQLARFEGSSGLTGVWQVAGRAHPSFVERILLDVAYLERACWRLDLEILARTIPELVLRRGA
jgi:lipopolysaccharide/colanic/teichoic acid biosynthesis glycosyltransferase